MEVVLEVVNVNVREYEEKLVLGHCDMRYEKKEKGRRETDTRVIYM